MLQEPKERLDASAGRLDSLRALREAGRAIDSSVGLGELLHTIADRAVAITQSKICVLFRYVAEEHAFRAWSDLRLDPCLVSTLRDARFGEDETPMGDAVRRNATVVVGDLVASPISALRSTGLAAGCRSVLFVPLIAAGRALGALALLREAPGDFASETLEMARVFADLSASVIRNAELESLTRCASTRSRRGVAATNRDRRHPKGDQPLGVRPRRGTVHADFDRSAPVQRRTWRDISSRWRRLSMGVKPNGPLSGVSRA